jgi:photosystem II stability/assembly factor-like uncharacterized protein
VLLGAAAASKEILSPDPSIRWRIGAAGIAQFSTNGGTTWETLSTGTGADLIDGSAPSPTVCWLIGGGGTVLRSTDGRQWQRVAFPEVVDLTGIRATDARSATITATDGRTFRTTDGGLTWSGS